MSTLLLNKLLSANMKKYIAPIVIGALAFGWINIVFNYLYKHLYVSIALGPKVTACKELLKTDLCNGIAYGGLWLAELPMLLVGFGLYSAVLVIILKLSSTSLKNIYLSGLAYMVGYIALVLNSEFSVGLYGVLCGVYQAFVFVLIVYAAARLTRLST